MMLPDLQFNELSCMPEAEDVAGAYQRVKSLIDTFKAIEPKGISCIRCSLSVDQIHLTKYETLNDFFNKQNNRLLANYLRRLLRYPFIDDATEKADQYSTWTFSITLDNEVCKSDGLAAAHLTDSMAIGFPSCDFWKNYYLHALSIRKATDAVPVTVPVICLSVPEHTETKEVAVWFERHTPYSPLQEYFGRKTIHLRDDHGKDKLIIFAKRLIKSPYVMGVINSLPFNPSARDNIEHCHPDGKIELRIPVSEDDRGLGLVVQTTGRTLSETERISGELRNM